MTSWFELEDALRSYRQKLVTLKEEDTQDGVTLPETLLKIKALEQKIEILEQKRRDIILKLERVLQQSQKEGVDSAVLLNDLTLPTIHFDDIDLPLPEPVELDDTPEPSPTTQEQAKDTFIIRFVLGDTLTPRILTRQVIPYLSALADLKSILEDIKGAERSQIQIQAIQPGSIILASSGMQDLINILSQIVMPWRKEYGKNRADVKFGKIQVALDILAQTEPNLPELRKIALVIGLAPTLETLLTSDLEPEIKY